MDELQTYNQDESEYYKLASRFSEMFEQKFAKIVASDNDLGNIKEPTLKREVHLAEIFSTFNLRSWETWLPCWTKDAKSTHKEADEIEINIDLIDALTFQAVDKYVKECLAAKSSK